MNECFKVFQSNKMIEFEEIRKVSKKVKIKLVSYDEIEGGLFFIPTKDSSHGSYNQNTNEIRVNKDRSSSAIISILIHELIHAVKHHFRKEMYQQDEDEVRFIQTFLVDSMTKEQQEFLTSILTKNND